MAPPVQMLKASHIPILSAVLALGTIIICYLVSVLVLKKPWWLLDITHYSYDVPSSFIFRAGMIPACVLIAFNWMIVRAWLTAIGAKKTWFTLVGMVAGGCLIVSSSMENGNQTNWTIHVICASSFFLLTLVAILFTTKEMHSMRGQGNPNINERLLEIRIIFCYIGLGVAVFALTGRFILPGRSWVGPLGEWMGTFLVIGYISLFHFDWKNENVTVQASVNVEEDHTPIAPPPQIIQQPAQQAPMPQNIHPQQVQYVVLQKTPPPNYV